MWADQFIGVRNRQFSCCILILLCVPLRWTGQSFRIWRYPCSPKIIWRYSGRRCGGRVISLSNRGGAEFCLSNNRWHKNRFLVLARLSWPVYLSNIRSVCWSRPATRSNFDYIDQNRILIETREQLLLCSWFAVVELLDALRIDPLRLSLIDRLKVPNICTVASADFSTR